MKIDKMILVLAIGFFLFVMSLTSPAGQQEPSYAGKSLGHWVKELKKGDEQRANEAIRALAAIGAPAVPELAPLLKDKSYSIRTRGVAALFQIGPAAKEAIPLLIRMLGDPNSGEPKYEGGAVTMTLGEPEAKALRLLVITTLYHISEVAMPALVAALTDNDQLVRLGALQALELDSTTPEEATAGLLAVLKDEHPGVRGSAGRLLARRGREIVPSLVVLIESSDANGKKGAIGALGELGPAAADAVSTLQVALRDGDEGVREAAAESLGKAGPLAPPVVESLVVALSDNSEKVQLAAAIAVAKYQVKEAIPVLLKTVQYDTTETEGILKDLDSQVGDLLSRTVEESTAKDATRAANALGEMGAAAREVVPALIQAKQHRSPEVRQAATEALAKIEAAIDKETRP